MPRPSALTKSEAVSQLDDTLEQWLVKAISMINFGLRNFSEGHPRSVYDSIIDLDKLDHNTQLRVIREIISYYQSAGWKVKHDYGDQREPDGFFTFS